MHNVEFAIWNYMPNTRDTFLRKTCNALTHHYLKLITPKPRFVIFDYSLFRILSEAERRHVEWCVVMSPGVTLGYMFLHELEKTLSLCPEKVGILGHIIDRGDRGIGLHEQMFIVNIPAWIKCGRPGFGHPQDHQQTLRATERSIENIHDNYTPLWVKPISGTKTLTPSVPGWKMVDAFIDNDFEIRNLSHDLRNSKNFLYPEQNSEQLSFFFKNISDPKMNIEGMGFSSTQLETLRVLRIEGMSSNQKIFVFNTESNYDEAFQQAQSPIDIGFFLASGFKDLSIIKHHGIHEKTKLVYYDISLPAINFKKYLFENWDGKNYPEFLFSLYENPPIGLNMHCTSVPGDQRHLIYEKWNTELKSWSSEQEFSDVFLATKKLDKEYINLNMYEDYDKIVNLSSKVKNKNICIWYSNIFNFTPTLALSEWNQNELDQIAVQFLSQMEFVNKKHSNKVTFYGEDVLHGCKAKSSTEGIFD